MRPMRLHKREISDPEILRDIIEECSVVRIGASDSDGIFVVPVNYGYDLSFSGGKADLKLYIHGAGEGRKAEAFAANPRVAVEMDRMIGGKSVPEFQIAGLTGLPAGLCGPCMDRQADSECQKKQKHNRRDRGSLRRKRFFHNRTPF